MARRIINERIVWDEDAGAFLLLYDVDVREEGLCRDFPGLEFWTTKEMDLVRPLNAQSRREAERETRLIVSRTNSLAIQDESLPYEFDSDHSSLEDWMVGLEQLGV